MKKYMKYAFLAFFLLLLVLSFFIIRPFITVIIASIIVAYIFFPVFDRVNKRVNNNNISAILVMLLIVVVLGLFLWFVGSRVFGELDIIKEKNSFEEAMSQLDSKCDASDNPLCISVNYLSGLIEEPETRQSILSAVSDISKSLLTSIPRLLINIIIFTFTTFYLFRDGRRIMKYLSDIIPLKRKFKVSLKGQMNDLFYSTIYGAIIIALIQGAVGTVAFILLGSTESPFFWGTMMAVAALVPFIGTGIIWLPMALFQIIQGYLSESDAIMWKGVTLLIVGAFIISMIDNVLKPKIIGERSGMHPLLIMIGAFGGIAFMGFIGVFLGPMILAFFMSFLYVYHEEKSEIFEDL